jgi:creatinine amidohydrolase
MSAARWATCTREEIGGLFPRALLVLPVAAIEQHGPHLATGTDTVLVEAIVERATQYLPPELEVLVAPALCYGASDHHLPFGGTLSLTVTTFCRAAGELIRSAVAAGCRRLLIVNGHGGNADACRLVATRAAARHDIVVATASYWDLLPGDHPPCAVPGHAGRFETSLLLAVNPDLVRKGAQVAPPAVKNAGAPAGTYVARPDAWRTIDGFTDDPRGASADEGVDLLARLAKALAETMVAFATHHPVT